jgi:hypothetical protein
VEIITEVKTRSPWGYRSNRGWDELFYIADRVGDMISVHTDPRWGGSFDLVKKARSLTDKPILAKGIHATDEHIERALDAGADSVLVVGRRPEIYIEKCLIEPHTLQELGGLPVNLRAVWNERDLETGDRKQVKFNAARAVFAGWLCQASYIRSVSDVHPQADAALVGTYLQEFAISLEADRRAKGG